MRDQNIVNPRVFFLLALLLSSYGLRGQSFEGTVKYSVRITGKSAQDYLKNEPPNGIIMHIKEDNFIVKLTGGRIARTFLFIGDSNHTYVVDIPGRRYFQRTYYEDTSGYKPVAAPTGKTVKVKGYDCQEYKVSRKDRKEISLYYVCDDFRVDTTLYSGLDGAKADFLVPGLGGRIPLMKVIKTPDMITSVELSYIREESFFPESFLIPEGFTNKRKRDPRK